MIFELNVSILRRMGWRDYSFSRGIGPGINFLEEDGQVRYFILFEDRKICYAIKEIIIKDSKLKKSKKYNEYKFITVDFSKKRPKFETNDFNSNLELLYLIREKLACNLEYQRFFQINSILK
jgi:hypothetical protein